MITYPVFSGFESDDPDYFRKMMYESAEEMVEANPSRILGTGLTAKQIVTAFENSNLQTNGGEGDTASKLKEYLAKSKTAVSTLISYVLIRRSHWMRLMKEMAREMGDVGTEKIIKTITRLNSAPMTYDPDEESRRQVQRRENEQALIPLLPLCWIYDAIFETDEREQTPWFVNNLILTREIGARSGQVEQVAENTIFGLDWDYGRSSAVSASPTNKNGKTLRLVPRFGVLQTHTGTWDECLTEMGITSTIDKEKVPVTSLIAMPYWLERTVRDAYIRRNARAFVNQTRYRSRALTDNMARVSSVPIGQAFYSAYGAGQPELIRQLDRLDDPILRIESAYHQQLLKWQSPVPAWRKYDPYSCLAVSRTDAWASTEYEPPLPLEEMIYPNIHPRDTTLAADQIANVLEFLEKERTWDTASALSMDPNMLKSYYARMKTVITNRINTTAAEPEKLDLAPRKIINTRIPTKLDFNKLIQEYNSPEKDTQQE